MPIAESEFLRRKAYHLRKVEISKCLDQAPNMSILLFRVRMWWRDNLFRITGEDLMLHGRCIELYAVARQFVSQNFHRELQWQLSRDFESATETDLLRECAWTILCSGFRASVLDRLFGRLSLCFCDWDSAEEICSHGRECKTTAMAIFRNERKIDAILEFLLGISTALDSHGLRRLSRAIQL